MRILRSCLLKSAILTISLFGLATGVVAESGSFTVMLDGATYINSQATTTNYGTDDNVWVRRFDFMGLKLNRTLLKSADLNDSMQNHTNVSWDSAVVSICTDLSDHTLGSDSIYVSMHKVTRNWVEANVSWNNAIGGAVPEAWATAGGDYGATPEGDSVGVTGDYARGDPVDFYITGSTVSDTLGSGLIAVPFDVDSTYWTVSNSFEPATMTVYYSEASTTRPQMIMIRMD